MKVPRLLPFAACAVLGLATLPADALELTGNSVQVTPTSSTDRPCPVTFTFRGKVGFDKQTTFTYRWERSDHAVDTTPHPPGIFDGAHAVTLTQEWSLGARTPAFHTFHGWMKLHILTPMDRLSEPANFTLDCGAPPPTLRPDVISRPTIPGGAAPLPK